MWAVADLADERAIRTALADLPSSALDANTVAFLRRAPQLVLDATAALTNVLDTHRYGPHCGECGTTGLCRTVHGIGEIFTPVDLIDRCRGQ